MKTPPSDLPPVPEGFDYYGMGPIKSVVPHMSRDILRLDEEEQKWIDRNYGNGGHHYALRSGSPIALANGLVPPAPAEEPSPHATPEDLQESIRANFTKSAAAPATTIQEFYREYDRLIKETWKKMAAAIRANSAAPVADRRLWSGPWKWTPSDLVPDMPVPPTTEAAAARTLVEAMAEQIRELKGERDVLKQRNKGLIGDRDVLQTELNLTIAGEKTAHANNAALRTELDALKRQNDMAATSYNEARIERDDAVRELQSLRAVLKRFTAAADAVGREAAK